MGTIHYAIYKGSTYKTRDCNTSGSFSISCCNKTQSYSGSGSVTLSCGNKMMPTNLVVGSKTYACQNKLMSDNVQVRYSTTDAQYYSIFTSSGWFTPPPGVTSLNVTVVGAGGGGGRAATFSNNYCIRGCGAGGAGSGYVRGGTITIPDSTSLYAEVGTGGQSAGATGGQSQLRYSNGTAIYTAPGGYGGGSASGSGNPTQYPGAGGSGGSGGGGGGPMQSSGCNWEKSSQTFYDSRGGAGGTNGGAGGAGSNWKIVQNSYDAKETYQAAGGSAGGGEGSTTKFGIVYAPGGGGGAGGWCNNNNKGEGCGSDGKQGSYTAQDETTYKAWSGVYGQGGHGGTCNDYGEEVTWGSSNKGTGGIIVITWS